LLGFFVVKYLLFREADRLFGEYLLLSVRKKEKRMALTEEQARQQVEKMRGFIISEAKEKAEELLAKANEECAIERNKLVIEEKAKIELEYERKEKLAEVQKRIAYSNEYNGARLQALKAQDECVQSLVEKARKTLIDLVADSARYRPLMCNYIVQALLLLRDHDVEIQCRACDKELVQGLITEAVGRYQELYKKNVEEDNKKKGISVVTDFDSDPVFKPNVVVSSEVLPDSVLGGVVLTSYNGRIVCSNTIESRLSIASEKCLPAIRSMLFPQPIRKTSLADAQKTLEGKENI